MILKSELYKNTVCDVDVYLKSYLSKSIQSARAIDASYERLWQTIEKVAMSGGKRMRPYLTNLAYHLEPGNDAKQVLPVAVAHELLHTAILMHDDIIDRDIIRHGSKNVTGIYSDLYQKHTKQDSLHYANSAAVLSGDLLIAAAYTLVFQSNFENMKKLGALEIMSRSIFDVVGGELMDVESSFILDYFYDPMVVYQYKTSSYSFVGPLVSGALLGGSSQKNQDALRTYGQNLGIAFQLVDDLIGVFGSESKTGKSTASDLEEGKQTYLVKTFYEQASNQQKKLFNNLFAKPNTDSATVQTMRVLLIESGAKEKSIEAIQQYSQKAKQAISNFPDSSSKKELLGLVDFLITRDY